MTESWQLGVGLQRRHRLLDLRQPFLLVAGPVPIETFCLKQSLARQGDGLDALINRGVLSSDPRLSQLRREERERVSWSWLRGFSGREFRAARSPTPAAPDLAGPG